MKNNNQPYIQAIEPADIEWRDGQPFSKQFNDVYFSQHNGLEETEYVFLQQNKLQSRWPSEGDFVIAEMGFGTGLNFLAACRLWLNTCPEKQLHFVSVDKHPLLKQDLHAALQLWPALHIYSAELLEHYPELTPGWHRLHLFSGRVCLTLYFGEVDQFLLDSRYIADAWFLDGFAPSLNESMWSDSLYKQISLLSKPTTSFATYTAAGSVRRGLQAVGFEVNKQKGYGNKRELLRGELVEQQQRSSLASDAPWFSHSCDARNKDGKEITIIGAGLAGAFTARKFADNGYRVHVIEAEHAAAQKASGNKQAMIYCRFSAYNSVQYAFYHQAYLYSLAALKQQPAVFQTGLLDVAYDKKSQQRLRQLKETEVWPESLLRFLDDKEARDLIGMPIDKQCIYMPQGGYVNPVELCENLLRHENIIMKKNCHVDDIQFIDNAWVLSDKHSKVLSTSALLVLTTAEACLQFDQCQFLSLKSIRGQVTHIKENEFSKRLQMPICYEGYVAPSQNGEHSLGASFNLHDASSQISQKDDFDNLNKLSVSLPDIYKEMRLREEDIVGARVGARCHATDYLPVVGPIPDLNYFENNYHDLRHGRLKKVYKQGRFSKGLFINVAHGSRGVVSAPLSAELLYSYTHSQGVFPLGEKVRHALHPARFLIKKIKRNQ